MTQNPREIVTRFYAIAGLFHDIGKFAERAGAFGEVDKDEVYQEYRYAHAYNTERALVGLFGERVNWRLESLPELTVLNLAARHHKPRSNFELLVAEADRIAAGHERMEADEASRLEAISGKRKSIVPLDSILSRVQLDGADEQETSDHFIGDWRYKLRRLSTAFRPKGQDDVFPCEGSSYRPEEVQSDYKSLWADFQSALRSRTNNGRLDIFDNYETVYNICRDFMWPIPESTRRDELQDVSLFEHSRLTAAISSCLYLYHADEGGMIDHTPYNKSAIEDRSVKKFLLFCGDISGIQNFVYQISSKGAYRTLKGRSFFLQILTETLARSFVSEFGLHLPNILYASGGKFYVLLPNLEGAAEKLSQLSDHLNTWLFKKFAGELYVRANSQALSADDLTRQSGQTLYDIWDQLTRGLILADRKKYHNLATQNYDLVFGTRDYKPNSCEVCHASIKNGERCGTCIEMENLGAALRNSAFVAISSDSRAIQDQKYFFALDEVFRQDTFMWLIREDNPPRSVSAPTTFLAINSQEFYKIPFRFPHPELVNGELLIMGSNLSFDKTFDEIANDSEGVKRLGILRMDVDDLGKIFSHGLRHYRHEGEISKGFYSLGRITTLSSQLNLFFGGIVAEIIKSDPALSKKVSVVYSGGDDLFLLGAWSSIPQVAFKIKQKFRAFVCNNPAFGLSGGVAITRGKFPIYKGAEMAGEAEEKAKANKYKTRDGREFKKDTLTFFDVPVAWPEFEILSNHHKRLLPLLRKKEFYPLLRRLRDIAQSWEKDRAFLVKGNALSLEEVRSRLMAEKWRWRMVYSLNRFSERHPEIREDIAGIQSFIIGRLDPTGRNGIELLGLLSRWLEFQLRDKNGKEVNNVELTERASANMG